MTRKVVNVSSMALPRWVGERWSLLRAFVLADSKRSQIGMHAQPAPYALNITSQEHNTAHVVAWRGV